MFIRVVDDLCEFSRNGQLIVFAYVRPYPRLPFVHWRLLVLTHVRVYEFIYVQVLFRLLDYFMLSYVH